MAGKGSDPKQDANKNAVLSLVWGLAAAVAYFGLIAKAVKLIAKSTNWNPPKFDSDGLVMLNTAHYGFSSSNIYGTLYAISVPAIPIAIVAVVALSIFARVKPNTAVAGVLVAGGVVGVLGSLSLFIALVANSQNLNEFLLALLTIVLLSVILRLQKQLRGWYQRNPALISLILGVVVIAYMLLANGTNISFIILNQIDIWLALASFAIALYGGINVSRAARKLSGGK